MSLFLGLPVQPDDVIAAAERVRSHVVRTPLMSSPVLDELTGARVLLKPECLQVTGSFKFRGAVNALACLEDETRAKGIVAWSSGNHAQAVALAAKRMGTRATVVMPSDAPRTKMDMTRALGAEIVEYDRYSESREEIGRRIAAERGCEIIPAYDYGPTIAGQGPPGVEIVSELTARGIFPDMALCCCGGGGLISGMSIALKTAWPGMRIYGVEPDTYDDTRRSLAAGRRVGVDPTARSICDSLLAPMPGELTFPIQRRLLSDAITVSDDEALHAMAFAFRRLKLVLEPGGAVALAAALQSRVNIHGKTVVVILSGGNVDPDIYARALDIKVDT